VMLPNLACFTPDNQSLVEKSPAELIKTLEKKIMEVIEESIFAADSGDNQTALEKAKNAAKKERQLAKQLEELKLGENLDLTFLALLNLANQYQRCGMYQEALHSYTLIVKNKSFPNGGRLRVNMGNIYFKEQQYPQAIKMYRMALDQISNSNRILRFKVLLICRLKIMKNIGIAFIKLGQYIDAVTSFETIMTTVPDHESGFNLILCYFAMGDKEKMKKGFQKLVSIIPESFDKNEDNGDLLNDEEVDDHAVFDQDSLRELARLRKTAANRYILLAAKLIAPAIDRDVSAAYDWLVDLLKNSPNAEMAPEIQIAKSMQYLKTKDFQKAIDCLKGFEKQGKSVVGTASTNLSFLYFLDGDHDSSEYFANIAVKNDKYNSKAQTNKGNIYYAKGKSIFLL
jgi:intraflagellar transport protein 88